ncbi:MAG: phosphoribosylanthranilate isomerase [Bacteroidetes bacterium]|nr:phosphoribosylanthranilate isomerase [Bacteroidota bacterium]
MNIEFNRFIQIAGIIDAAEAELLIENNVNYLGFPLRLPVNKEDLTEDEAARIIRKLSPPNFGIIITYLSDTDQIIPFCKKLGAGIIQLHGDIKYLELLKLRNASPELKIIKSLVIRNNNLNELKNDVLSLHSCVDAFITDTFDPSTGASGATGKTHDWKLSRQLVELSPKPVILAGGLNPKNVYNAILEVKPAGVDSHTGVENASGRKDINLVKNFVSEALRGFEDIR